MPRPDELKIRVDRYLSDLERQLERMRVPDKNEILREIETHLRERLERLENADSVGVDAVFQHFGSVAEIAAQFQEDRAVRRIAVVRSPVLLTEAAWKWARISLRGSLALLIALFGYLSSLTLLVTAVGKIFYPERIGMWIHANSWGFSLGAPRNASNPGTEVLGYWYIPAGLVAGALLAIVTTLSVKWFASLFSRDATMTEVRP